MSTKKMGTFIFGIAILIVIGFTIYKITVGKEIGLNEIVAISSLLMVFFSAITWGTREDKNGILQEEELGQRITEKSSKISYYILITFILGAVFVDKLINDTVHVFLLVLLGLAMIILPIVEFFMARKYQL